jgi:hypothetical protein
MPCKAMAHSTKFYTTEEKKKERKFADVDTSAWESVTV